MVHNLRKHTNNYALLEDGCLSHKVIMQKLKELDNDLVQHLYLEKAVMLPRVLLIESELKKV